MLRSFRSDRTIARTIDMGLRLLPHPPIPIVMPSRSWATTSSSVNLLSVVTLRSLLELRFPLGHKGVARFIAHARQIQLEREALLEAVGPLHVHRVNAVQRLLGGSNNRGAFLGDFPFDANALLAQ